MEKALKSLFERVVKSGDLTVVFASGDRLRVGDGTGNPVEVRFADRRAQWAFLLDPDLRLGELFTDGRFLVERGRVYDFLDIFLGGLKDEPSTLAERTLDRVRFWLARLVENGLAASRRNVASHYDLDARLYDLFLDEDRQYSCAYYENPSVGLDEAQAAKRRHVAAKLVLKGGERVLDIGSGWGGLALYLARTAGAGSVLGVTLSEEQIAIAGRRARKEGLSDRVSFALQDYRTLSERFDRIVSVGMFEHVGYRNYRTFFETCRGLLAEDGVMLLHTIGLSDGPDVTNPWLVKHIFPGGRLPALSELLPLIEKAGLVLTDVEVLRLHYAYTLRAWRERFLARRDEALALYGERFCRMWEFYLAGSETAFRHEGVVVFQLQLARRQDAAPLTRGYIEEAERRLRAAEESGSPS